MAQPHQRPQRLSPCPLHPGVPTSLCAPCLRQRLSLLHPSTTTTTLHRSNSSTTQPRRHSCDIIPRHSLDTCPHDSKPIKDLLDLEFQDNKHVPTPTPHIVAGIRSAATAFTKRLRKWRNNKQPPTSNTSHSEVGLGRASCDMDPRFSIDLARASIASVDCAARLSVDDEGGACFLDAPRASWDGYLHGGRGLPRGIGNAPVVSVIENAMASVYGFEHCGDRKMQGLDRSKSVKKDAGVRADDESRMQVSDAIGIFDGTKLLITEKELNEWRLSNSNKDDSLDSFDSNSKEYGSVSSSSDRNGDCKKNRRQWSKLLSMWGSMNKPKGKKFGDGEKFDKANVEYPHADFIGGVAKNGNGQVESGFDCKMARSHSNKNSRGCSTMGGSARETVNRSEKMAIVRQRNPSASKLSMNQVDSGLLRFYLTPLRSRRRYKSTKSRFKHSSPSLDTSVLRL